MPKSYELAPVDVTDLLAKVMDDYHQRLVNVDVKVGILMVFAPVDEETGIRKGHALNGHAGAPASAQIKLVPLKDRITKKYDVELLIDGDNWKDLTEPQKIALLDHELTHIIEGDETDDQGRPKLKMRDEDFITWGFLEVVRRHGADAMEARSVRKLIEEHGPLLLGTAIKDPEPPKLKNANPPEDEDEEDDSDPSDVDYDEPDADEIAPRKKR